MSLLFTELVINGKQPMTGVCARDTIVIDTDERNFSISFAALDYTDNTGICYRSRQRHELLKKYMSLLNDADKRTAQKDGKKRRYCRKSCPKATADFLNG